MKVYILMSLCYPEGTHEFRNVEAVYADKEAAEAQAYLNTEEFNERDKEVGCDEDTYWYVTDHEVL